MNAEISLSQSHWKEIVDNTRDLFVSLENLEDITLDWNPNSWLSFKDISDTASYCEIIIINILNLILLLFKEKPQEQFQDTLKFYYNKFTTLDYEYGDDVNFFKITPLTKKELQKDIPHTMYQLIDTIVDYVELLYAIRSNYQISENCNLISYTQFSDSLKKMNSCMISYIFIFQIPDMEKTIDNIEDM